MGESDLQVAIEKQTELPRLRVERGMLLVREELGECVPVQDARVFSRDLRASHRLGGLSARETFPERAIAFRPAEPVVHAVFRRERCVQSVALQPRTVPLGEVRQAIGQPARTTRLEGCEGLVEHATRYRVRVTVRGAAIKSSRPSFHRAAERVFPDETRL